MLYMTLLFAGFVLIGAEIFIPGGILGIIGSVAWVSAAVVGWQNFPEPWNMLSAFALLFAGIFTFVIWIKYFPKSRMGKTLSLSEDSGDFKAHIPDEDVAVGNLGTATSTLRPAGIATFDGKRLDVVTDGEWIDAGQAVRISSIAGGHVCVASVEDAPES